MPQPASSTIEGSVRRVSYLAARQLASELMAQADESGCFDAAVALDEYAQLQQYKSIALNLVYEEYCRRLENGEQVDHEQFAARFPQWQRSILRQVEMHDYLERNAPQLASPEVEWPVEGEFFLGFVLEQLLGKGAFSRVYSAVEPSLGDRKVVVKICTTGPVEAQTHGKLEHPGIVPVHSVKHDHETGLTAICMPLLSCVTLFDVVENLFPKAHARSGRPVARSEIAGVVARINSSYEVLPEAGADVSGPVKSAGSYIDGIVDIGLQLAQAVAHTHRRGFFHSDIKPSNVLLTGTGQALLFDFNLAFSEKNSERFVGGTLPYMAPEQLRELQKGSNRAPVVDARTDIFAIGATLYEALCGALPFQAAQPPVTGPGSQSKNAAELLRCHEQAPLPLLVRNPHVNRSLSRIVERCLAPDPKDRWQSADELAVALRKERNWRARARRWSRRCPGVVRWIPLLAATVLVVAASITALRDPFAVREYEQGVQAFHAGEFGMAVAKFDSAIRADGNRPEWIMARGRAYMLAGDYESALTDFGSVSDHQDSGERFACMAHCRTLRGVKYRTLQEFEISLMLYKTAIRKGFSSAALLNNVGFCYLLAHDLRGSDSRSGRVKDLLEQAATALQQAVSMDPHLGAAWHNLAVLESIQSKLEQRPPDVTSVRTAMRLGAPSAELYLDAAEQFATAAAAHADLDHRRLEVKSYNDEANAALRKCYKLGGDPSQILKVIARYPAVFTSQRAPTSGWDARKSTRTTNSVRLVDPCAGQLVRLSGI